MTLNLVPRGLLYIQTVAEIGSVQGASRELGISASAIDRQILLMEARVDLKLFDRSPAGMTLTVAGQTFLILARRWQLDCDGLSSELKSLQGIEMGLVRIAVMDSQANGVLPDFVASMMRDMPGVQLNLEFVSPDNAVRDLRQGTVDIAMAFNVRQSGGLHSLWSADLPLGCVVARCHPLAKEATISLSQISQYPIALQSHALSIRKLLEDRHEWLVNNSQPPLTSNSLQFIKQMATAGSHLVITSELDVAREVIAGDLVFRPISDSDAPKQRVDIAIDARRNLARIAISTAERLAEATSALLERVRQTNAN